MATIGASDQRRGGRGRVLVLLAVLLTGATIWWFVRDGRPRADVGQVLPAAGDTVEGSRSTVAVPWGRLDVVVAAPSRGLPSDGTAGVDLRAPRRGSFVGVSVGFGADWMLPMPRTRNGVVHAPGFTLVADGRRYSVTGLADDAARTGAHVAAVDKAVWVAVEGSPERLLLEVTYDGESQTVDPRGDADRPGRFAELAGIPKVLPAKSCGPAVWPRSFSLVSHAPTCAVRAAVRVPYVAGLGWAPPGRSWLAVTVETTPPWRLRWRSGSGTPATEYGVDVLQHSRSTFQLGGQRPAAVVELNELPGQLEKDPGKPQQAIFQVASGSPATPVTVTRQIHTFASPDPAAGAPQTPVVPVTWRVTVP